MLAEILCWLLSPRVLVNAVKSYHSATKHLDSWSDDQSSQHRIKRTEGVCAVHTLGNRSVACVVSLLSPSPKVCFRWNSRS